MQSAEFPKLLQTLLGRLLRHSTTTSPCNYTTEREEDRTFAIGQELTYVAWVQVPRCMHRALRYRGFVRVRSDLPRPRGRLPMISRAIVLSFLFFFRIIDSVSPCHCVSVSLSNPHLRQYSAKVTVIARWLHKSRLVSFDLVDASTHGRRRSFSRKLCFYFVSCTLKLTRNCSRTVYYKNRDKSIIFRASPLLIRVTHCAFIINNKNYGFASFSH